MKVILSLFLLFVFSNAMASTAFSFMCRGQDISIKINADWQFEGTENNWNNYWGTATYSINSNGRAYSGTIPTHIMQVENKILWISLLSNEEGQSRKNEESGGSVGFAALDYRGKLQANFTATLQKLKFNWADTGIDISSLPDELICEI